MKTTPAAAATGTYTNGLASATNANMNGTAHAATDTSTNGAVHATCNGSEPVTEGVGAMSLGDDDGGGRGGGRGRGGRGGRGARGGRGGRGGKRDRDAPVDSLRTRPAGLVSKLGVDKSPKVTIISNYFGFKHKPDFKLLQYRVDFSIDEDRTFVKKHLLRQHKDKNLPAFIFDGSIMYTTNRVYPPNKDKLVLTSTRKDDNKIIEVTIKLVGEVFPTDHHFLQFYGILLRKCLEHMKLEQLGRNFYDPSQSTQVPTWHLEVWPGYITSIRQHEYSLLLCTEVSNKIIRTDTCYDQLRLIRQQAAQSFEYMAKKALIGSVIMTKYNKKTYRVDDIDFKKSASDTFDTKEGAVSYADYYEQRYSIKIKDPKQPLLISQPKDRDRRGGRMGPVLLIPELCHMTGLTDEQRNNYKLTSSLSRWTRMEPTERVNTLLKFARSMTTNTEVVNELKDWDLVLENNLTTLQGRLLSPEHIVLQGGKTEIQYKQDNADWTNNLKSGMLSACQISRWLAVVPERESQKWGQFLDAMKRCAPGLGITLTDPKTFLLQDTRTGSYINELNKIVEMKPNMVLAVTPSDKGDTYTAIKKKLCLEHAYPSQVVTCQKVLNKDKSFMSIATKVLVQMAAKLGGEPWAVKIPIKNAMVVGYDTYHDKSKKGASVGALVASLNSNFTRYISCVSTHHNENEMTNEIKQMMVKSLRKYQSEHKNEPPDRIFYYRDGVGEGQINQVYNHELEEIRKYLTETFPDKKPKLTMIIVSKRINTRFFMAGQGNSKINPPSGTVVDDVVTLPERYDFFLVSQSVRQGTVNPTSYNVIFDESGLKPNHIQMLSYKLTHLYFNWPGTVRVPAPCQYAHKLAELCGEHLHGEPHAGLADTLFFL